MSGNLLAACGQLIGVGFDGLEAPPSLLGRIAEGRVGLVVLFARNVGSPTQVAQLCGSLLAAAPPDRPLLIAVDQEGGRVQRLREPWPSWPPARRLGPPLDPAEARAVGEAMGAELRSCGIRMNLAPVLDVHTNPANPVIGDRAFAETPGAVARHAGAYAEGLALAGVAACGKHFPGHGDTSQDSHHDLPVVSHDADRLETVELAPFRELAGALPAIMSAHVIFTAWDPGWPATLSPTVMNGLLRDRLGFGGVVLSDDMEMRAAADLAPPEELAVRSVSAGVDVVSSCHDVARQERMLSGLVQRCRQDEAFAELASAAAVRLLRLKRAFHADPMPSPDEAEAVARDRSHHALAARVRG